jgi:hypothetical protein
MLLLHAFLEVKVLHGDRNTCLSVLFSRGIGSCVLFVREHVFEGRLLVRGKWSRTVGANIPVNFIRRAGPKDAFLSS